MLHSMTGYGKASRQIGDKEVYIELRSLNSKDKDIRLKFPPAFKEKEIEIRNQIIMAAERGKIDMTLNIRVNGVEDSLGLDKGLFKKYYRELVQLCDELEIEKQNLMQAIVRMPNVIAANDSGVSEEDWINISQVLDEALVDLLKYRADEGRILKDEFKSRVSNILLALDSVGSYEEERMVKMRDKIKHVLENNIGAEKIDVNRFEQELLFYIEKLDITEEKVRLQLNCDYFLKELENTDVVKGRKLGFITQEIGREINTLGSKANHHELQKIVVGMKDELEKIKEQLANVV